MPRPSKPPRLWLRRTGGAPRWVILDGSKQYGTGCSAGDREGAEKALSQYIAGKYQPDRRATVLDSILVADVVNIYLQEHAPHVTRPEYLAYASMPILKWWGRKHLSDIRGRTCRAYAESRAADGVSSKTARNELATMQAAIRYYHREYGPLSALPIVTLPEPSAPRSRWLTRSEAARLLWAARRTPHLKRFILIGLYTGSRSAAVFGLRWLPSMDTGWIDLERGTIHRRGAAERETQKRRPPVPIHAKLLPWLRRWHAADTAAGVPHAVHYRGQRVENLRRSWSAAREAAGLGKDVTPHVLRHTRVTWLLQAGVPEWEVGGYVGMSSATVREVYGHHSPDAMAKARNA